MKLNVKRWWKSRTALVGGGLAIVVLSAACVQLAPMARSRFVSGSEIVDTGRAASALASSPAVTTMSRTSSATRGPSTAAVIRGPIAEVLILNGRVAGTDEMPLSFLGGVRLLSVSVRPGQAVEQGQIVAEADARELVKELSSARAHLETSMVRLAQSQVQAGARLQEAGRRAQIDQVRNQRGVVEAEIGLRRAQDELERVQAGASEADKQAGQATVATAQATFERAQADLTRLTSYANTADVQAAEQDVANARITLQRAEADLTRLRAGADPADVRTAERELLAAQSEYEKAKTELDKLMLGPDPLAVSAAQRDVDRAQSALRAAQTARVDSSASRSARDADIRRAQADLDQAQTRLDALNQPPRQIDVELARNRAQSTQLGLDSARAKLDRVRLGPDATVIDAADLAVSKARTGLQSSETKLAAIKAGPTDAQLATAIAAMESARSGIASANAKLAEINSHPTPTELQDAQDRVTIAQSTLTRALADATGSTDSADTTALDLALLQNSIEQDRALVAGLEKNYEASRLRAPSAGVVTALFAVPGETALPAGRPVMSLAREGDPIVQVEATDREAARLSVGQDAALKIDGLDDVKLVGSVTSISDRDSGSGKIVTLSVAWPDARIAYGAATEVTLSVDQRDNALIVPEKAIRSNGARKYVEYMEGSSRRTVDVQIGITSGGLVEVLKGLSEGQTVVVRR